MTTENLVTEVVLALAAVEDVEPLELEYTLADHIDPELLETLEATDNHSCELSFRVENHEVTVTNTGVVHVDGTPYLGGQPQFMRSEGHCDQPLVGTSHSIWDTIDRLPGMVYRCQNTRDWKIDYLSPGCKDVTGYDRSAFVVGGVSFGADLIHPDDQQRVRETVQKSLRRREPFDLTYRIQTADGDSRQVRDRGVGVFDNDEVTGIVGFVTDISNQESTQDMHPQQAECANMLATGLPDLCFLLDKDCVFRDVILRPRGDDLLYTDPSTFLGSSCSEILPNEAADQVTSEIDTALTTMQPSQFEYELTVDNRTHHFRAWVFPLSISIEGKRAVLLLVSDTTGNESVDTPPPSLRTES